MSAEDEFEFVHSTDELDETGYDLKVLTQLAAVRETHLTNMHNVQGVHEVADECGLDRLAAFLDELAPSKRAGDADVYLAYLRETGRRRSE